MPLFGSSYGSLSRRSSCVTTEPDLAAAYGTRFVAESGFVQEVTDEEMEGRNVAVRARRSVLQGRGLPRASR